MVQLFSRGIAQMIIITFCLTGVSSWWGLQAQESCVTRIKDIATFEGVRKNVLVGYGLVVGLNGTGDGLDAAPFARESLISMLERLGVNTRGLMSQMRTKNLAAVMVTAFLPPFARHGSMIDVSVSAMGNSKSLNGGTLLVTPLVGADGEVYAVAQGAVITGGFVAGGAGAAQTGTSVVKGVPTSGRIVEGAVVEREVPFQFQDMKNIRLVLRNPDFTTAKRVAAVINNKNPGIAKALDPTTIELMPSYQSNPFELIAAVEQLYVEPDQSAQVIVDESNGVVIITQDVKISPIAIAHQNLTVRITEDQEVSQPGPLSRRGDTIVVPRSQVSLEEGEPKNLAVLKGGTAGLSDLVNGLNALGLKPRDMIPVLENIKAAGALHAEVKVR